jgi:hypothetical protein
MPRSRCQASTMTILPACNRQSPDSRATKQKCSWNRPLRRFGQKNPYCLLQAGISCLMAQSPRAEPLEQVSWRPFHPRLLGSPLAEYPLASSPRFIDPTGGRCVPLPFKQVHYFIHPLGGAIPVLPEILEGLHLASQRLRSRAQSPVQSAPAIRQGLAPAGGAAPGTRSTKLFFPAWHSEPHEKT